MKRTRLYVAVLALPLAASLGCEKDTDEPFKDCEKGNYGIVTVTFGATTAQHTIRIAYSATSFRQKVIAAGNSSDTVHVRTGTYPLSISSVGSGGQVLETYNRLVVTERCNEQTFGVTF
jgi:hypothetical protein